MSQSIKSRAIIALALIAKLIITFAFLAALPGCAAKPATFAQRDQQADLYSFKTFAFFPTQPDRGGAGYSTPVGEQLKVATRRQMERLGYVYDESSPDLRVNITLIVQQRAEVRSAPSAVRLPYRAWGTSSVETVEYREGTLAIDLVDTERRALVWRGIAQDRITRQQMQKVDQTIHVAVREVFAKYPRKV